MMGQYMEPDPTRKENQVEHVSEDLFGIIVDYSKWDGSISEASKRKRRLSSCFCWEC